MGVPSRLLNEGESRFTEFKKAYTTSLLKTISAFANIHDGRILLGVDDEGKVVGLENVRKTRLDIENAVNDNFLPRPYFEMESVEIDDRKLLILMVFKGEDTPYYYHGKAYVRNDTATVEADRSQLHRLILAGQNSCFESLPTDVQDLSFRILEARFHEVMKIGTLSEDLLRTLELKKNGQSTNAAALLSDRNPVANANLILVAYRERTMDAVDRLSLENVSVLEHFDASMDFYRKHILSSFTIRGANRVDHEEVPLIAFREAVANAIVHRDYLTKGAVRIEFFPDQVVVVSPGTLPEGISVEEYKMGRLSVLRNRVLADIFFRLGLMEKLASGVRRIKEQYRDRPNPPVFEVTDNAVTVILPRSKATPGKDDGKSGNHSEPTSENEMPDSMSRILDLLTIHPEVSRAEAQNLLGLGKTRSYRILDEMKKRRLIVQIGEGRSTRYRRPSA